MTGSAYGERRVRPGVGSLALVLLIAFIAASRAPAAPDGIGRVSHGDYIVLAWNDLGMHCLNNTYGRLVILPPANTLWAQVVRRGNPPVIVTSGITVEYRIEDNTSSLKAGFAGFWGGFIASLAAVLGISPVPGADVGLYGKGLSGTMDPAPARAPDHFMAPAVPATPLEDITLRRTPPWARPARPG